jgi:hypothetical protein
MIVMLNQEQELWLNPHSRQTIADTTFSMHKIMIWLSRLELW